MALGVTVFDSVGKTPSGLRFAQRRVDGLRLPRLSDSGSRSGDAGDEGSLFLDAPALADYSRPVGKASLAFVCSTMLAVGRIKIGINQHAWQDLSMLIATGITQDHMLVVFVI